MVMTSPRNPGDGLLVTPYSTIARVAEELLCAAQHGRLKLPKNSNSSPELVASASSAIVDCAFKNERYIVPLLCKGTTIIMEIARIADKADDLQKSTNPGNDTVPPDIIISKLSEHGFVIEPDDTEAKE